MSFQAERHDLHQLCAAGKISPEQWEAALLAIDHREALHDAARLVQPDRPRGPMRHEAPAESAYYAHVSERLYCDRRMGRTAKDLVALLIRLARGRRSCDAFIDQLAEMLGRSRRTIQYAQRRAEACGYLRVEHVREGRVNDPNFYHLLPPAFPQGRPEPRRGMRPNRGDRRRRPRRRRESMGVQNLAPHKERSLKGASLPLTSSQGKGDRSAARRGATCGPAPLASAVRLPVARQGAGSKTMPPTGPP